MNRSNLVRLFVLGISAAGYCFPQVGEDLRLTIGKAVALDYPGDLKSISTSDPNIVDYTTISAREVLLQAKAIGSATVIMWSKAGQRTFYNVNVELNLDPLRHLLKDTFPNEDIQPRSSRDSIALNGHVSKKEVGDQAMTIAAGFGKTVINNMQVAAPAVEKQILLRVRFAQLDRNKESQFGINLTGIAGQTQLGGSTGQFSAPSFNGSSQMTTLGNTVQTQGQSLLSIPTALSIFGFDPKLNIGAFIKALETESILEILAEPNLVTTSGKEAYFLSGGEFPIPILQGGANSGAVTIQFREFGIRVRFLPVITEHHTIKMHLNQEVSTLDQADGVTLNGFQIPALATRKTETDIELAEGQSFVVSGLVNNQEIDSYSKIPVLSSLPIFGALFKSKQEQRQRTDLLLVVTPEITEPLNPGQVPNIYMPKNFLVRLDPNSVEAQALKSKPSKKN